MNYITVQRMRKQAFLSKLFGADPETKAFNKAVAKLKADLAAGGYPDAVIKADPASSTFVRLNKDKLTNKYEAKRGEDGNFNYAPLLEDIALGESITPEQKLVLANKLIDGVSKDYGGYDKMVNTFDAKGSRDDYAKALVNTMQLVASRNALGKPQYDIFGTPGDMLGGHDLAATISPRLRLLSSVIENG